RGVRGGGRVCGLAGDAAVVPAALDAVGGTLAEHFAGLGVGPGDVLQGDVERPVTAAPRRGPDGAGCVRVAALTAPGPVSGAQRHLVTRLQVRQARTVGVAAVG